MTFLSHLISAYIYLLSPLFYLSPLYIFYRKEEPPYGEYTYSSTIHQQVYTSQPILNCLSQWIQTVGTIQYFYQRPNRQQLLPLLIAVFTSSYLSLGIVNFISAPDKCSSSVIIKALRNAPSHS